MRTWCAAVAVSALFALPLCAQQNGDGAGAAAAANGLAKTERGRHHARFSNSFCASGGSAAQAFSGWRQIERRYAAWQNCAPI